MKSVFASLAKPTGGNRYRHFVFRVYGCSVDDIGEMALIGRDILNLYRFEFDAPHEVFAIY
jgi:hypothetical protein